MTTSMQSDISDAAIDELKGAIKGTVWKRGEAGFVRHSQLFNAAIRSPAQVLARPVDVRDVSEIVKFCDRHNLSPSVKSGGYGTHGWAVEGDVLIDMRLIAQMTIERPLEGVAEGAVDWTSMHETPHKAVKDPDTFKGKFRMPSAAACGTPGVGPPAIHTPFSDTPSRRSADEAFEDATIAPPENTMELDGERSGDTESDRPTRKLRVSSPGSGRASHTSSTGLITPPTTNSPHTPADGTEPRLSANQSGKLPFSFEDEPTGKSLTTTSEEVLHDEGMLPPSADRPAVGVDMRGFVGREVGGWDTVWNSAVADRAAAESTGATYVVPADARERNLVTDTPRLVTRSGAPPSARPFDFGESTPTLQVNPLANPHGNPSLANASAGASTARQPFQFMSNERVRSPANTSDRSTPNSESLGESSAPTVTHVAFAPTAPVPHTYVTFGAGASQKNIDAFCAAHPLEAVTAEHSPNQQDQNDEPQTKKPTIIADSTQPDLYQTPQGAGFGPGVGSFFAPGVGLGAGGPHGYGTLGFGQPSTFGAPGASFFGQPTNPVFGSPSSAHTVPYYVPFAAHPVGSSVMLLGGFGFLSRLRGLSMDCLVEAEMVLPDGRVVWVSKEGVKDEHGNEVELDGGDEVDLAAEEFLEGERERARRAKEKEKEKATEDADADDKYRAGSDDKPETPKDELATQKRGLWWALRGAGSAFGIVVRYKARAFPVPVVFAGNLIYNFDKSTAPSLIKHFRDCIKAAPRELYANCILTAGPRNKGALVVIQICYAGSRADGLPFLQAISSWEGGACLLNEVQEKQFVWQQDSIAKVLKGGSGRKWFIRSDLITSLTDEIIHQTVRKFSDTPDGCTWLFELSGGALTDTTDSCLPKKAREAAFTIVAFHQWKLEQNDPACVITAEEWIRGTLGPQSTGGPFPCFLERREKRSRTLGVYGPENWARLCALKKKYDPSGMFKHNFWPLDGSGEPVVDPREMRSGADITSGHYMDDSLDDRGVPIAM